MFLPSLTLTHSRPLPPIFLPSRFPSTKTPSALYKQVPLPPIAAMPIDHFAGSGSAAPDSTTTGFVALAVVHSDAPSGEQSGLPSGPSYSSQCLALSPLALDLCVDLSSYSLPQQPMPDRSAAPVVSCQHHMVLRPRQPRFANLSFVSLL